MGVCARWFLLLGMLTIFVNAQQQKRAIEEEGPLKVQLTDPAASKDRMARQSKKPKTTPKPRQLGFFGTIKQLLFDQFNETTSAYSQLGEILGSQFADSEKTPKGAADNSTESSEAPPKLTRQEFLNIIRTNLIALRRLSDLEWRLALQDSKKNIEGYKREFHQKLYEQFKD